MVNPDNTKIRFEPSEDSDYVQEAQEVKPIMGPKPAKDFKKVMSRTGREGKNEEDELLKKVSSKDVEEEAAEMAGPMGIRTKKRRDLAEEDEGPVSLFDLSKKAAAREKEGREGGKRQDFAEAIEKQSSPSEAAKEAQPIRERPATEGFNSSLSEKTEKKDRFTTHYTPEQPDITYVNPLAAVPTPPPALQPIISETKVERPQPVSATLQEICAQLVKQMYTIESKGKVDTVVILQYPPLFKDAKIVVSSFETAKGQFNISFENLTQAAQLVLDKEENRKMLIENLEKRGYNVQILTTTTTTEGPMITTEEQHFSRDRSGDEREGQERNEEATS